MALDKAALLNYLADHARDDLSNVKEDTELFSSGLIDSFAMVDLLMFLEKHTGARLGPEDIDLANLDTIGRILAFAEKRGKR